MTARIIPRVQPCSGCGRAVADVRIDRDKALYGDDDLVAQFVMHTDGGYPSERVDNQCNWPPTNETTCASSRSPWKRRLTTRTTP